MLIPRNYEQLSLEVEKCLINGSQYREKASGDHMHVKKRMEIMCIQKKLKYKGEMLLNQQSF